LIYSCKKNYQKKIFPSQNMKFLNSYNILDKIISFIRNYELLKDKRLNGKSIIDFGCGSDFQAISRRYAGTSKAVLIDLYGDDFTKNNIKFINYNKDEYINLAKKTESNLINFKYFLLGMNTMAILK